MTKNPIQEERMKRYFLEATKEILTSEGISSLSVRSVAKRAGYSYATLYNYFKGLPELVSFSILDFQKDCTKYIQEKTSRLESGNQKIKSIVRAYVDYFVQYPSLFNLFFIEGLYSHKINHSAALFLDSLCQKEFDFCVKNNLYSKEQAIELQQKNRYMTSGILLIYLNRSYPADYNEFVEQLENQLNSIMG